MKRHKLNSKWVENLVYVHTNLWLLARRCEQYNHGSTKKWHITGDVSNGIYDDISSIF